jgi:hypothetical protein
VLSIYIIKGVKRPLVSLLKVDRRAQWVVVGFIISIYIRWESARRDFI